MSQIVYSSSILFMVHLDDVLGLAREYVFTLIIYKVHVFSQLTRSMRRNRILANSLR